MTTKKSALHKGGSPQIVTRGHRSGTHEMTTAERKAFNQRSVISALKNKLRRYRMYTNKLEAELTQLDDMLQECTKHAAQLLENLARCVNSGTGFHRLNLR